MFPPPPQQTEAGMLGKVLWMRIHNKLGRTRKCRTLNPETAINTKTVSLIFIVPYTALFYFSSVGIILFIYCLKHQYV